jgi:hypothetical protein
MSTSRRLTQTAALVAVVMTSGCATRAPALDYTAFQSAKPATLLVMPPLNDSPDVKGSPAIWAHATQPLAEAGYYVLPVTLVDETFRQNGVHTAHDAQSVPLTKLREVFGADAAVYIHIKKYGSSYQVVASDVTIEVEARIVDLRNGALLWQGSARASSAEQRQQNQGGLVGLLVTAIVQQVVNTAADTSFNFAGIANTRLLGAPRYNGVLPGPRSPHYGKPPVTQ